MFNNVKQTNQSNDTENVCKARNKNLYTWDHLFDIVMLIKVSSSSIFCVVILFLIQFNCTERIN